MHEMNASREQIVIFLDINRIRDMCQCDEDVAAQLWKYCRGNVDAAILLGRSDHFVQGGDVRNLVLAMVRVVYLIHPLYIPILTLVVLFYLDPIFCQRVWSAMPMTSRRP